MRLQVKAHRGHLSDAVRAYAEKRFAKLDRRLHDQTRVEVTLAREYNPSIPDDHRAEAVVYAKRTSLVARESAASYEAAIDRLVDKLERQIERYRKKRLLEPRREAAHRREGPEPAQPVGAEPPTQPGEAAA